MGYLFRARVQKPEKLGLSGFFCATAQEIRSGWTPILREPSPESNAPRPAEALGICQLLATMGRGSITEVSSRTSGRHRSGRRPGHVHLHVLDDRHRLLGLCRSGKPDQAECQQRSGAAGAVPYKSISIWMHGGSPGGRPGHSDAVISVMRRSPRRFTILSSSS